MKINLRRIFPLFVIVAGHGFADGPAAAGITEPELVRRTQELCDAVAPGDKGPWQKYYADDCSYFDERGNRMDKTTLVAGISPLPAGYSGTIKVVNVWSHIGHDVAILSYDLDETETVHGQHLTARYHATDTWRQRQGVWQIVAGQVLRYYEDPPAGRADPAAYPEYAGTYELAPGVALQISTNNGRLLQQRGAGAAVELIPETAGIFFRRGVEGRILFRRAEDGRVDAYVSRRNNQDIVWKKTR